MTYTTNNYADKLTAKWVPVTERLPKLSHNTLMFKGGMPEPTVWCWYNEKSKQWLDTMTNQPFHVPDQACWLEYNHESYPERKW